MPCDQLFRFCITALKAMLWFWYSGLWLCRIGLLMVVCNVAWLLEGRKGGVVFLKFRRFDLASQYLQ